MSEPSRDSASPLAKVLGKVFEANSSVYHSCLSSSPPRFWDIVIVTACNQDQRIAYLQRIQRKLDQREIPRTAEYLVIEDPPGTKISSGGSTIYVLHTLQKQYVDRPDFLSNARILLIHAGGYSSRLPHVSACGKLFMTIPQKDDLKGIEVFDIKLILYLHLLHTMSPGVFVTSADGIELFASRATFPATTRPFTITALAHPSPLNIATTHGVFELAPESLLCQEQGDLTFEPHERSASLHKCLQFHHKPSMDHLHNTPGLTFNDPRNQGETMAYTDSCYYFDPQTATVLANLYLNLPPQCDLEAWADILHFQDALDTTLSPPSSTAMDDHTVGRDMVKRALQGAGVQLDLLVLNASWFYHLGTMTEFLDAVCLDRNFMASMNIENPIPGLSRISLPNDTQESDWITMVQKKEDDAQDSIRGPIFVQNSHISELTCLPPWSMIIDTDLLFDEPSQRDALKRLPAGVCMFTLQLGADSYVTFTFSTKDDIKKPARHRHSNNSEGDSASSSTTTVPWWETLCVFETIPVSRMLSPHFYKEVATTLLSTDPQANHSLWDAPMFDIAATKKDSTLLALQRLARLTNPSATTATPASSRDNSPPEILARGWISLKDAAEKARPIEIRAFGNALTQ